MTTTPLNDTERSAVLALCLMAAMADGEKNDKELAEFKRIFDTLEGGGVHPVEIYNLALSRPMPVGSTAARLTTPEARSMAYEMAVCVCDADDVLSGSERSFLEELRTALGLGAGAAAETQARAEGLSGLPLASGGAAAAGAAAIVPPSGGLPDGDGVARMILNYAILNGALELLPQSMATMAIIPLQTKMVYRIGKEYGYELDRGHVKDFLATAGVGLTSQVLEGYTRKLVGGLITKFAGKGVGKMIRGVAEQGTSSAFSFASTYALGLVAQQYYAGGRTFAAVQLQDLFSRSLDSARQLHSRYVPQIQERARSINPADLLSMVKGQ